MATNKEQNVLEKAKAVLIIILAIFVGVATLYMFTLMGEGVWYENLKAEITNQPYARTFTVSAEGKITARPDIAYVSLSVVSLGETVAEVNLDNTEKMNRIIDTMKKLGVEEKDIKTTQYNLWPRYNNQRKPVIQTNQIQEVQQPEIIGYELRQSVEIKIRDLSTVDQVIDQGTKTGANQVGSLRFDIDDSSELKMQAREIAFDKAKEKAQQMAAAAGVTLGDVITFSEGGGYSPYPQARGMANFAMEMDEGMAISAAPAIEPGSQEMQIIVNVTYEIE